MSSPLSEPTRDGLTAAQAHARLAADGHNELPSEAPHGMLALILEVLREPMFLLLISAGDILWFELFKLMSSRRRLREDHLSTKKI